MNLIGQTYFHDLTYVPGLSGTQGGTAVAGQTEKATKLARYIAQYEAEYLTLVLGEDIYTEFQAWIDAQDTTAKWVALKAKLLTARLTSPIANYVFCPYWKSVCQPAGAAGTTTAKGGMVNVEPYRVQNIEVWNDMVRQNITLFTWLYENAADYEHDDYVFDYAEWTTLTTYDNLFGL